MREEVYGPGDVSALGCGDAISIHGEKEIQSSGAQGTRGAHLVHVREHLAHVRDLGRVEAELLVERRRALPSRKAGMCCGKAARGA